jgi:hypothetical protein
VRECKPTLPTYMQVSTLSYIQEALCDDVQPCVTTKLSEIRQNGRSNHNKRYLYQLCRPHGGECPPASCPGVPNKRYLPVVPTQIKKSFFIASPKDHAYQNQNNLPLPSHENHPSIYKDSLSCARVLYIGEKKC